MCISVFPDGDRRSVIMRSRTVRENCSMQLVAGKTAALLRTVLNQGSRGGYEAPEGFAFFGGAFCGGGFLRGNGWMDGWRGYCIQ